MSCRATLVGRMPVSDPQGGRTPVKALSKAYRHSLARRLARRSSSSASAVTTAGARSSRLSVRPPEVISQRCTHWPSSSVNVWLMTVSGASSGWFSFSMPKNSRTTSAMSLA